ncbi:flagellar motor protein MotB [Ralstonia pickettii]|nr:flagellar motor protein MotB [Ralstonia pickettii]
MKRRRMRKSKNSGAPKWMVTFSDMVTLILVFFILLFSMSQINQNKFDLVSQSFQNRGIFDFSPSIVPLENPESDSEEDDEDDFLLNSEEEEKGESDLEEDKLNSLTEEVEQFLAEHNLSEYISANRTAIGVELILQDSIFFNLGEAEILDEGFPFLEMVGKLLAGIENEVRVEGHTDSRPIRNYRYPSNWELSGARASVIVRYLIDEQGIDEARFSIAGYGDTRPIVSNDTTENMKQNRRVEIVILEESNE